MKKVVFSKRNSTIPINAYVYVDIILRTYAYNEPHTNIL